MSATASPTLDAYSYGSLVGGKWRTRGVDFTTKNPARPSERVGEYSLSSGADVRDAGAEASRAQPAWSALPSFERAKVVARFLDAVEARTEAIALAITREQGKPLGEARGEVGKSLRESRVMVSEAARVGTTSVGSARPGVRNLITRRARGVIAGITPWNFPILTPMRKIAPALVFGNAMILKPSEMTPGAACFIVDAGRGILPDGVLQLVNGGPDVGEALVRLPCVAGVTFTGSVPVGKRIYAMAAERLAEVSLELGGKNAAIVHDVAELDRALDHIAGAAFLCGGQRCTAVSRVLVQRSLAAAVIAGLTQRARAVVLGDGMNPATTLGPLVSAGHRERVGEMVTKAIAEGARAVVGAKNASVADTDGFFYEPTILVDVPPRGIAAREEIFGPVISILVYDTLDEALELLNDVDYGLTAALFSNDHRAIERFVDQAQTGMLHINHGTIPDDHMPFGGIKNSGVGAPSVGASAANFYTTEHAVYLGT